jgi:hypothetical protein
VPDMRIYKPLQCEECWRISEGGTGWIAQIVSDDEEQPDLDPTSWPIAPNVPNASLVDGNRYCQRQPLASQGLCRCRSTASREGLGRFGERSLEDDHVPVLLSLQRLIHEDPTEFPPLAAECVELSFEVAAFELVFVPAHEAAGQDDSLVIPLLHVSRFARLGGAGQAYGNMCS